MSLEAGTTIDLADDLTASGGSGHSPDAFARGSADRPNGAVALTLADAKVVAAWCGRYGVTVDQLTLATTLVGLMPAALDFYLTSRGRPTKVVTDAMRASRAPIRPRDRRRKPSVLAVPTGEEDSTPTDVDRLGLELSKQDLNVRIAADALHERPCPTTIHAYDEAQDRRDATVAKLHAAEDLARSRTSAAITCKLGDGMS